MKLFCPDYNDCQIWGICDHLCEDRPGTHHCSCADGYFLEQGHMCKANVSGTSHSSFICLLMHHLWGVSKINMAYDTDAFRKYVYLLEWNQIIWDNVTFFIRCCAMVFSSSSWTTAAHFHQRRWSDDGWHTRAICQNSGVSPGQRFCCGGGIPLAQWHNLLEWYIHQKGQYGSLVFLDVIAQRKVHVNLNCALYSLVNNFIALLVQTTVFQE